MHELLTKVLDELRGAWRFRWWSLILAWLVCVGGWFVVFTMPNVYEASARVYVDSRGILRPLLQGLAVNPDVASGLDVVRQALLSRPQLEQVARETDLDLRAKTPEAKEQLITGLQLRISIDAADIRARTNQGEGLYQIKFQDHNRDKSIEVVQTLLNAFVENALGDKRSGQETAQRFLEEQIADYERRLAEAEARLAEFKKRNVGMMPDNRGDYFQRLQLEVAELDKTRAAVAVAESRRSEIERQLSGEEPFLFGFDTGATISPNSQGSGDITFRIQALEKQLDDLLLRYTERHPEVIALRSQIEELRKRQEEELQRVMAGEQATGSLANSLKANPVVQSLEIDLKRTELQIAEQRQELAQRQAKVAELKRLVDSVPEVEAQLAQLNRDYEVTRQKYLELVQRRETASISQEADRTGTVKFDVIDPPAAAFEPVSPNRPRLLIGILLAGLAAGAGLAYLLNQVRPVFLTMRSLAEVTGLPVLAAVSRTWIERHRRERRMELLKFSTATLLLLLAFGLVLLRQQTGVELVQRLIG